MSVVFDPALLDQLGTHGTQISLASDDPLGQQRRNLIQLLDPLLQRFNLLPLAAQLQLMRFQSRLGSR
jgi:hypothetical protein